MQGSGPHFDVMRLQDQTPSSTPIGMKRQDKVLKGQGIVLRHQAVSVVEDRANAHGGARVRTIGLGHRPIKLLRCET